MIAADILIVLVHVCVILAGFAGLVMTQRRVLAPWTEAEKVRLTNLLLLCFCGALFAAAPLIWRALGLRPPTAMMVSQLTMAMVLSVTLATRWAPAYRVARAGRSNFSVMLVVMVLLIIATLLQVISATRIFDVPISGSYIAGVTIVVCSCGFLFARLVVFEPMDR